MGDLDFFHYLKCEKEFFEAVFCKRKTYEIRLNDRGFLVDDYLVLQETAINVHYMEGTRYADPTGRELLCRITHVLLATTFPSALTEGFCILSIKPLALLKSAPEKEGGSR